MDWYHYECSNVQSSFISKQTYVGRNDRHSSSLGDESNWNDGLKRN